MSYCRGCGLVRLEVRSQKNGPATLFLLYQGVPHGEALPAIERTADGAVVPAAPLASTAIVPILYEPICAKAPPIEGERRTRADRARFTGDLYLATLTELSVTRDEWREFSGMTGLVHIRNHERKIDRYKYIQPRMLVHTLCGIHERVAQGAFQFVDLVTVLDATMWGRYDAVCSACAYMVRRRGAGFTFDGSLLVEEERE